MKKQTRELKPCPFCGTQAVSQKPDDDFIECGCLCRAMTRGYRTYDEAVEAWNSKTMFKFRSECNGFLTDVTFDRNGRQFSYPQIQRAMEYMRFNHEHHQR